VKGIAEELIYFTPYMGAAECRVRQLEGLFSTGNSPSPYMNTSVLFSYLRNALFVLLSASLSLLRLYTLKRMQKKSLTRKTPPRVGL